MTHEAKRAGSGAITAVRMFFSIVFCGTILVFTWQWLLMAGWIPAGQKPSESRAIQYMQDIIDAQEAYFTQSRTVLGQEQFAPFLPHLWVTPDHRGVPVRIGLIPKKLAFAMDKGNTRNGYFFVDIHQRYETGRFFPVDYQREWAVAAVPGSMPDSGASLFLADQSGNIYRKKVKQLPAHFPLHPLQDGWQAVMK